ncbi:MAG: phosphoenolpyruvate carboxykinase (ATP), partial [Flavobacteriaceae bacterium]|nr:phosphoenolpyruvate carboxykinase (ATP) [Flavobacteriaceae bacterium]
MTEYIQLAKSISLEAYGIKDSISHYQLTADKLHDLTIKKGQGTEASTGALAVNTGEFTGRSPL